MAERRQRRARARASRADPLGSTAVVPAVQPVLSPQVFQPTIVDKLQSSDDKTKLQACILLAASAFDAAARKGIMRLNGVEKLLAILAAVNDLSTTSDSQLQIYAGAGMALRNLLVGGGEAFAEELLQQAGSVELLIRITRLTVQYIGAGCPASIDTKQNIRSDESNCLLEQAIASLWQTCIYDERALAAITHSSILPELLPVLTSTRASLVVATGELLATITDEYAPAIEQVWKASGAFGILLGLAKVPLTVESCQASILATVILYNIRQRDSEVSTLKLVFGPAADALKLNVNDPVGVLLERTRAVYAALDDKNAQSCEQGEAALKEITGDAAKSNSLLRAQISALELLTNICSANEQDLDMDDDDADMAENAFNSVPEEVRALWRAGVDFASIRALLVPLPQLVIEDLSKFDMTFDGTAELLLLRQEHALTFLSNFFLVDDASVVGAVPEVWHELMVVLRAYLETNREEPAAAEALRALVRQQKDCSFIRDEDVQVIIESSRRTSSDVRCSAVCIMGTLGTYYTAKQPCSAEVKYLADVLFAHIMDPSAIVLAEVVNSLIDIFAEDANDPLFKEFHGLQKLTMCLKGMQTKAKQQAKSLGVVGNQMLSDAITNLESFIEYKSG